MNIIFNHIFDRKTHLPRILITHVIMICRQIFKITRIDKSNTYNIDHDK